MGVMKWLRRRWDRFMGRGERTRWDVQSEIASVNADIEFQNALRHMQTTRVAFDIRSTPPPPEESPTSISGLNSRLNIDDRMMKEALNELDETSKD